MNCRKYRVHPDGKADYTLMNFAMNFLDFAISLHAILATEQNNALVELCS